MSTPKTYTSAQVRRALEIRDQQWVKRIGDDLVPGLAAIIQPMLRNPPPFPALYPHDLAEFFMAPAVQIELPPEEVPESKSTPHKDENSPPEGVITDIDGVRCVRAEGKWVPMDGGTSGAAEGDTVTVSGVRFTYHNGGWVRLDTGTPLDKGTAIHKEVEAAVKGLTGAFPAGTFSTGVQSALRDLGSLFIGPGPKSEATLNAEARATAERIKGMLERMLDTNTKAVDAKPMIPGRYMYAAHDQLTREGLKLDVHDERVKARARELMEGKVPYVPHLSPSSIPGRFMRQAERELRTESLGGYATSDMVRERAQQIMQRIPPKFMRRARRELVREGGFHEGDGKLTQRAREIMARTTAEMRRQNKRHAKLVTAEMRRVQKQAKRISKELLKGIVPASAIIRKAKRTKRRKPEPKPVFRHLKDKALAKVKVRVNP